MIKLKNVSKAYPSREGVKWALEDVSFHARPRERWAIIGPNGGGKSTLIRLIGRAESPTSGTIENSCSVSWPLALGGGFQDELTGEGNIAFMSHIYGIDENKAKRRVEEFAELGSSLYEPVRIFSNGMRARLAFGLALAFDFECFLIDEIVSVGDQRFREKCHVELHEKRKDKGFILVSHDLDYVARYCTHAAVMDQGKLQVMPSVQEAIAFYAACA